MDTYDYVKQKVQEQAQDDLEAMHYENDSLERQVTGLHDVIKKMHEFISDCAEGNFDSLGLLKIHAQRLLEDLTE
ncbi:MAG: hypothetical protein GF411_00015 [Candidatus Lokiarchaeota archaeon]|nr:hypothetical protein [Candidatus Lokiarchaeota archaeon]